MKVMIPPIKCQGIKSKLVPFIKRAVDWSFEGRWIEPFMGSLASISHRVTQSLQIAIHI